MKLSCPYCLSEVDEKADVCKSCSREIQKIFSLNKEIDLLKNKITTLEKTLVDHKIVNIDQPTFINKDGFDISLLFFLLTTILQASIILALKIDVNSTNYLSSISVIILLFFLIKRNNTYNIWPIILLFLLQPICLFLLVDYIDVSVIRNNLTPFAIVSLINVFFIFIITIFILIFNKKMDRYYVLSFKPMYEKVYIYIVKMEKIDKLILIIISFITSIITFLKLFSK